MKFSGIEFLIFTALAILNLAPFVAMPIFPSTDGPSHLANAFIIKELVFGGNPFLSGFYQINPEPVPNWTGHAVLAILMTFLPALAAEKVLLTVLLLGLPFAFRGLMKAINSGTPWLSYLIFPFTHSIFLIYGFYNFSLGVILLFTTLMFWIKSNRMSNKWLRYLLLSLLMILTYFSHLVTFGLLMMSLFIMLVANALAGMIQRGDNLQLLKKLIIDIFLLVLSGLIPILLGISFFMARSENGLTSGMAISDLLIMLGHLTPLTSIDAIAEHRIIRYLAWLIGGLSLTAVVLILFKPAGTLKKPYVLWLFLNIILLMVMFFLMPSSLGTASYTSERIAYVAMLTLILLLSALPLPQIIIIPAAVASLLIGYKHDYILFEKLGYLQSLARSCVKAGSKIPENTYVFPVNMLEGNMTGHFTDFCAIDKPVALVYNYECNEQYFPVIWNKEARPNFYLGDTLKIKTHYLKGEIPGTKTLRKIDYVLLLGNFDTGWGHFYATLDRILTDRAVLVYNTPQCKLYRLY